MSNQSEALRLARELEGAYPVNIQDQEATAAELLRLHAANLDCAAWYEAIKADYEALRKAVIRLHAARGRHHTQIAGGDLYDLLVLKNERPTK